MGARWATNDITIWRIGFACWIKKATCTHAHAHVHSPVHTRARTHTRTPTRNIYRFPTTTMIRENAGVKLCVECLSCFNICISKKMETVRSVA